MHSSPIAKRAKKMYKFFEQNAAKQNIAPRKVAADRSYKHAFKDISTKESFYR